MTAKTSKTAPRARRPDSKRAREVLRRLRETSARYGGPTQGMTEKEVIASIKKVREEFWDHHLASRPRR